MKRSTVAILGDFIGANVKVAKSCLNWEGAFFLTVGLFLLFQEYFLAVDISSIVSNHRFLALYAQFTSSLLVANRFFATPFLAFCFYAILAGTSRGLPRRLCDIMGIYYFLRMVTLLFGLNILIFDVSSSRFLLITQLLFFLPYSLLVWGWVYWRLDVFCLASGRSLFKLEHETETPRVIDYFVAAFSTAFSASISAIKGTSARS
jgi:hypothetical protein